MENCNLFFVSDSDANVLYLDNMQIRQIKLPRNNTKSNRLQIDSIESKTEEGQLHPSLLEIPNNVTMVICKVELTRNEKKVSGVNLLVEITKRC